jgi:ribA/ribD-fused uncharacterized protein
MNRLIDGIYGFKGEYAWLSNMHILKNPIEDEYGFLYYSSENYYVAHKTHDVNLKHAISLLTPKQSKTFGRKIDMVPYWDEIKISVMRQAIKQKFDNNSNLKQKLIETGDLYIEETNWWNDTFWGVCNGVGKNVLGNLLMELRNDYQI